VSKRIEKRQRRRPCIAADVAGTHTQDDHLVTLEVDGNGGGRGHTGSKSVGRELTSVVDDEVGLAEVLELFRGRSDKHVVL